MYLKPSEMEAKPEDLGMDATMLRQARDFVLTGWQRHPEDPIIAPGRDSWDSDACYKPFAILDKDRWMLWYNGRRGGMEQIGFAFHEGENLGFSPGGRTAKR